MIHQPDISIKMDPIHFRSIRPEMKFETNSKIGGIYEEVNETDLTKRQIKLNIEKNNQAVTGMESSLMMNPLDFSRLIACEVVRTKFFFAVRG